MDGMSKTLAILGCGDFLRWQLPAIQAADDLVVSAVYDPDAERAAHFAAELGAEVAASSDAVFADPAIDIVGLYVPPWIRRGLFEQACAAGKHLLLTKPLAPAIDDCQAMVAAAERAGIRCGVIYSRTGDAWVEACKRLLDGGEVGRLALYRQDWLHAYPQWNDWATDPEKNGGPFMDAMIHNLNAASFLMGRPVRQASMQSDRLSHPDMACADTESVIAHYEGGVAHLFITWAADLAVHSTAGNDREHIDIFYLVTDQGWHLTRDRGVAGPVIRASRHGEVVEHAVPAVASHYQAFVEALEQDAPLPDCFASIQAAAGDIVLLRALERDPGNTLPMETVSA